MEGAVAAHYIRPFKAGEQLQITDSDNRRQRRGGWGRKLSTEGKHEMVSKQTMLGKWEGSGSTPDHVEHKGGVVAA